MKPIHKYWVDKNGNKWSKSHYSRKEAICYSNNIGNYYNCIDCENGAMAMRQKVAISTNQFVRGMERVAKAMCDAGVVANEFARKLREIMYEKD